MFEYSLSSSLAANLPSHVGIESPSMQPPMPLYSVMVLKPLERGRKEEGGESGRKESKSKGIR